MSSRLRHAIAEVLLVLAPVTLLAVWWGVRADLGDRIATHFTLAGRADGYGGTHAFVAVMTVLALAAALAGVVVLHRADEGAAPRPYVLVICFTAWLVAATSVSVLLAGRHVAPTDARSGWGDTLVSLAVALAFASATYLLVPPGRSRVAGTRLSEPGYVLSPGERAAWVGSARSRGLVVAAVVVALVGAVVLPSQRTIGVMALVIAILLAWLHSLTVRVDDSGVTAHFGPVSWPRVHVALDDVEGISVEEIDPLRWGGWGVRLSRRGTALVVRRGPGLVLGRRGGSDLAITVDDPDGAAELVAALQRRG